MNNEPVAWMETYKGEPNNLDWDKSNLNYGDEFHDVVPLYTHPADTIPYKDLHQMVKNVLAHPAKELHLSLQKSKETGELLAVTYTDDEHRIVEVLWKKPPAKTLTDFEIRNVMALDECWVGEDCSIPNMIDFARAILRKAQEK